MKFQVNYKLSHEKAHTYRISFAWKGLRYLSWKLLCIMPRHVTGQLTLRETLYAENMVHCIFLPFHWWLFCHFIVLVLFHKHAEDLKIFAHLVVLNIWVSYLGQRLLSSMFKLHSKEWCTLMKLIKSLRRFLVSSCLFPSVDCF